MRTLTVALIALCLIGCASTRKVRRELSVLNEPGVFSLRIGSVEDVSHSLRYEWINAMGEATIRQDSKIKSGAARVEIRDAAGMVVHTKSLSSRGSFATGSGKPGVWRILVVLDHATGPVGFEVRH